MLASEPELTESVREAIVEAVRSGILTEARINEAYERILSVKETD